MQIMNLADFLNRLRSLNCIDGHELEDADVFAVELEGLSGACARETQRGLVKRFLDDPYRFMMQCSDAVAEAIWKLVEARQKPLVLDQVVLTIGEMQRFERIEAAARDYLNATNLQLKIVEATALMGALGPGARDASARGMVLISQEEFRRLTEIARRHGASWSVIDVDEKPPGSEIAKSAKISLRALDGDQFP
jgi:hypothetical protein